MEHNLMAIANFEPQDDIMGFLRRMHRQEEAGRELVCPFKYDGRCNENARHSTSKDILCDNNYTLCQVYTKLNQ